MVMTTTVKMHPLSRRRRGSVLVLVVATLGLLAVIGTVYIVSARGERANSTAAQTTANFNYAEDAVLKIVGQTISRSTLDGYGNVHGLRVVGPQGLQASRRWTIPELGSNRAAPAPGNYDFRSTDYNPAFEEELWLVPDLYRPGIGDRGGQLFSQLVGAAVPKSRYADNLSILGPFNRVGAASLPMAFNPASGAYDLSYYDPSIFSNFPLARVVSDPLPSQITVVPQINPDKAAPENFRTLDDGLFQLLPYSDASGLRYRWAVRIIDANRMANINSGYAGSAADNAPTPAPNGDFHNSYFLGIHGLKDPVDDSTMTAINTNDLLSRHITGGGLGLLSDVASASETFTPFDLADELELRSFGDLGTRFVPRPALRWPNTFGNISSSATVQGNVRRRHFTAYSFSTQPPGYPIRPYDAANDDDVSPKTRFGMELLKEGTDGAASNDPNFWARNELDTRDIRGDSWVGLADTRIVMRGKLENTRAQDSQGLFEFAEHVTNLATVLRHSGLKTGSDPGFPHDQIVSYLANYMTRRVNNWHIRKNVPDPDNVGQNVDLWSLVTIDPSDASKCYGGPSYIDDNGIVLFGNYAAPHPDTGAIIYNTGNKMFRPLSVGRIAAGTPPVQSSNPEISPQPTLDVLSAKDGKRYLGYAAQPFINEVAVATEIAEDPLATPPTKAVATHLAIELYNPYPYALDLTDYVIKIQGIPTPTEIPLKTFADAYWLPPGGYLILTDHPESFGTLPPKTKIVTDSQFKLASADAGYISLYRLHANHVNEVKQAQIDQYNFNAITPSPAAVKDDKEVVHFRRHNGADPWLGTVQYPSSATPHYQTKDGASDKHSLGALNVPDPDVSSPFSLAMDDPTLGNPDAQGAGFNTVGEFNKLVRISHVVDPANGDATTGVFYTLLKDAPTTETEIAKTQFPGDARRHFDFRTPAMAFGETRESADPTAALPQLPATVYPDASDPEDKPGDPRAAYFLENLSFDPADRMPGKINVNTASYEVLASLMAFEYPKRPPMPTGLMKEVPHAVAIMAYRYRSKSDGSDPRVPLSKVVFNFTDTDKYPGYGIRSMGELAIPVSKANASGVTTLLDRDKIWSAIYNSCTVRSDSFVVYGYMEAIKPNPRFTGVFNNSSDWYAINTATETNVTDDPNNSTSKLLRVGRRRWVAVIDRSDGDGKSRVVAMKVLPH